MVNIYTMRKQKGFSLVELLIVLFMIGLVMGSIFSLYRASQRTATVESDVIDVQQNLRVAMDSISRDIRHAGFLTAVQFNINLARAGISTSPAGADNLTQPTKRADPTNPGNYGTLPLTNDALQPAVLLPAPLAAGAASRHADSLTLNTATNVTAFARLSQAINWMAGGSLTFTLSTVESTDLFEAPIGGNPGSFVRIVDPVTHRQATSLKDPMLFGVPAPPDTGTIFEVIAIDRNNARITLRPVVGNDPTGPTNDSPNPGTNFKRDCVIFTVANPATNPPQYPASINYCLGPAANCPPAGANAVACPPRPGNANDPALCLIRTYINTAEVVATGISGLQFTYLMDNGNEVSAGAALPDLTFVRAIRVTITGQTAGAAILGGAAAGQEKTRTMSSIIKLQNRYIQF